MSLTGAEIRNAKPRGRPYKLGDGHGLYLEVMPNASKYWRLKYRYAGKDKRIALGVYPAVSAKQARLACLDLKAQLHKGVDPAELRKVQKTVRTESVANDFESMALEWFSRQKPRWAESHWVRVQRLLERDVFPWLGGRPVAEISPVEVLAVLHRIEKRGAADTVLRAGQILGQIFRFAIAAGKTDRDPARYLRGALTVPTKGHFAAITDPKAVGPLLLALDAYQGTPVVQAALQLAPLTIVRPGELRKAPWSDFDLDGAEWHISASRMKTRQAHVVPLSRQAVAILRELYPITNRSEYVFPSARTRDAP